MAATNVLKLSGKAKARGRTTSELRVAPLNISARPEPISSLNNFAINLIYSNDLQQSGAIVEKNLDFLNEFIVIFSSVVKYLASKIK